ncbi:M14 family metallopeptidase [Nocardioides nanhaiensis]|uniref:Peptidase M14 domain-containing protein n=1 Tax=Nocardioides nanhaiensis TaxID=1476871 RepID=A0ABP8W402_9ACTN
MRKSRSLVTSTGLALAASALLVPPGAAEPGSTPSPAPAAASGDGRGAGTASTAQVSRPGVRAAAAAAQDARDPIAMPSSYPFQPELRFYRDNPDDAADTAELLTHPDLAPQLTEWMAASNRISTQVVGQSTSGRDLYLVTVTAPESEAATAQQTAWREQISSDPTAAAADSQLLGQYKTPVWVSANIHGNEWEGTDAVMRYIDYLVTAPEAEVSSILRNNRLYFSLSLNPDGRTLATRATSLGLDPNRDMITDTTPEAASYVRTAQAIQPIYAADLHGYTRVLQLEPCGPPHGSNYEYDLYLPHNYALALKVEQDVVDAEIPGNTYYDPATGGATATNTGFVKIPYRDTPDGWDDFPPIFTAQYAAYYGAATATVELPLSRNAPGGRQSPANARVNTAVGTQVVESTVEYMNDTTNARQMLLNQIEVFARGLAGEPKKSLTTADVAAVPGPAQWKPLWDVVDDQEPVTLPRAYVIPVGDDQRSASDAARLVDQLLFHEIQVGTLDADTTVGGTTYPAGSYVVDMHQAKRGLANALLDLGDDISDKVPTMYDISAWSYSYLWGADVAKVGLTTDAPLGAVTPITASTPVADKTVGAEPGYLALDVAGVADVRAVNEMLDQGAAVSMTPAGRAVVGPEDTGTAVAVALAEDVALEEATEADLTALADEDTRDLDDLSVAYLGTQDDRLSLTELGFDDLTLVTTAGLNSTPTALDGVDVLWAGSAVNLATNPGAAAVLTAFAARGGTVLGRGTAGFNLASGLGLVAATATTSRSDANGIVAVEQPEGSFLAAHGQDSSFFYPATWFTGLGAGTEALETYAADPMLAGHWLPSTTAGVPQPNGPANAAGNASVIGAESASGVRTVVFGTSVFFRTHPKGGLSQAGRAVFWAGPEGEAVEAPETPSSSTTTLQGPARVTYPASITLTAAVAASADEGTPSGSVQLSYGGEVVAEEELVEGSASFELPRVGPGRQEFTASYVPDGALEPSTSEPLVVVVDKAPSATSLGVTKLGGQRVRLALGVAVEGVAPRGTVVITDRGRQVRRVVVNARRTVTLRLAPGQHRLRARFLGTNLIAPSASPVRTVRITR